MIEKTCPICRESSFTFKTAEEWVCLNSDCGLETIEESEKETETV